MDDQAEHPSQHPTSSLQISSFEERHSKNSSNSLRRAEPTHQDQKLHQKIQSLNAEGIAYIQSQEYQKALFFFSECERILQYSASCGCAIDRSHILAVLNNQAVAYQRESQLEKASSYVQAIIYNITVFLQNPINLELVRALQQLHGKENKNGEQIIFIKENYQVLRVIFQKKYQLALYYLKFSGLNSLNQTHQESLKNARKALATIKQLCTLCLQYQELRVKGNPFNNLLLKELNQLKQNFTPEDKHALRLELQKLGAVIEDNSKVFRDCYQKLSAPCKQAIEGTDIHTLFDLEPINIDECILDDSPLAINYNIEISSSYVNHIKKLLSIIGIYFAISVELEEISSINSQLMHTTSRFDYSQSEYESQSQKNIAEAYLLQALLMGYKLIPVKTNLLSYLQGLYIETYGPIDSEMKVSETYPTKNQEIQSKKSSQIKESEVIQNSEVKQSIQVLAKDMQISINVLTQKYKNYMIEKDISLEEISSSFSPPPQPPRQAINHNLKQSISRHSIKDDLKSSNRWEEQKKESKKLAGLLKPETMTVTLRIPQENYLNEVASIDSISMANSHSAAHTSLTQKTTDGALEVPDRRNRAKLDFHLKQSKQIPECQSQIYDAGSQHLPLKNPEIGKLNANKSKKSKSCRKSKSTKNIKPKQKSPPAKQATLKRVAFTQRTVPSLQEVAPSERTNHKSKEKKSPSKSSRKPQNRVFVSFKGPQLSKTTEAAKRKMGGSENMKSLKGFSSIASVKDHIGSIKFNRVKPITKINPILEIDNKTVKPHLDSLAPIFDRPNKTKSNCKSMSCARSKKNNSRQKSSSSQKSLGSKKSLSKTLKSTHPHPNIYTSNSHYLKKH